MPKIKKIGFWLVISPWVIFFIAVGVYLVCENIVLKYFVQHPTTMLLPDGNTAVIDGDLPAYVESALWIKTVALWLGTINCVWFFFATWFGLFFLLKTDQNLYGDRKE